MEKWEKWMSLTVSLAMAVCLFSGCGGGQAVPVTTAASMETEAAVEYEQDYNRCVEADSEEARTAVLSGDIQALADRMPTATWNSLPKWNGVTVTNMIQYDELPEGQPQEFSREDMENISEFGFNFVRVPLDTRLFFDLDDPGLVHLDKLVNLDELISWGAEYGVHICVDVHNTFGFSTDGDDSNDTIWDNPEEQAYFLTFWEMLARRYQNVSSNLLSFNLMNEPTWGLEETVYTDLMRQAIERIRAYTPDRLIFVDMLNTARDPVYSLAEEKVAQAFHFYEPDALTHAGIHNTINGAYPVISGKNFISKDLGPEEFVMEGNFPAGTKISFSISEIHKNGTLMLTADGKEIFSTEYGYDAVGENGCTAIMEEGTEGEYRGYDRVLTAELSEEASVLCLSVTGESYWFNLGQMYIVAGENRYLFEPSVTTLPEGTDISDIPNPHIILEENGDITDDDDMLFSVIDAAYTREKFANYQAFSEETGVAVMLQEFGISYMADYGLTLEYLNDLLEAADGNGLSWCSWDYFGMFNFYAVRKDRLRAGATNEEFSNGWIATEMLEVFQNHLTK